MAAPRHDATGDRFGGSRAGFVGSAEWAHRDGHGAVGQGGGTLDGVVRGFGGALDGGCAQGVAGGRFAPVGLALGVRDQGPRGRARTGTTQGRIHRRAGTRQEELRPWAGLRHRADRSGGRRVLEVTAGRTREAAERGLGSALTSDPRPAVEAVSIDMWPAFEAAIGAKLPQARIVYDPFHAVSHANVAADEVLRPSILPPPMLAWRKTGRWADTARRGSAIDAAPSPASVMNRLRLRGMTAPVAPGYLPTHHRNSSRCPPCLACRR